MKTRTKDHKQKNGRPDKAVLDDVIQSVVTAAQPNKVILFGSAARGQMGPDSDIDLLVIKSGKFNHWRLLTTIYQNLRGSAAVDVVLVSQADIERYGDSPYLVYYTALRDGRIVYGA
jgi:uncharacterized protein